MHHSSKAGMSDREIGTIYETKSHGKCKIVEYKTTHYVTVEFIDTGYRKTTKLEHIKSGSVKDKLRPTVYGVGYLGVGRHKPYKNGKLSKAYNHWKGMIQRSYSGYFHKTNPSYANCTVADEWHNFQNFAEWYYSQNIDESIKMHVDKDIRVAGNKIYSPETCLMVTPEENGLQASKYRMYKTKVKNKNTGQVVVISNQSEFAREYGIRQGEIGRLVRRERKTCHGWVVVD